MAGTSTHSDGFSEDFEAEIAALIDEEERKMKSSQVWARKCVHSIDEVRMSDGTILHASDFYSSRKRTSQPDVGFYLDRSWHPEWFAYLIEWADFGLPEVSANVLLRYARAALRHARDGEIVEVACLGSHGRTGTFLAICDLLTMEEPDGDTAIANIRRNHCSHAIETAEQEWYVCCVAALLTDQELPLHPAEVAAMKRAKMAGNRNKKGGKKKKR